MPLLTKLHQLIQQYITRATGLLFTCLIATLMSTPAHALLRNYLTIKAGIVDKDPAASLHLGTSILKYINAEVMYAKYAPSNNILTAQAKLIVPLSNLISGTGMSVFGILGGGWVNQSSQNSIAPTYGLGAETTIASKVGLSFTWQHVNSTNKTSHFNFFGLGSSYYFG